MFLRHLVPWPSVDIHGKFYGDRSREPVRQGRGSNPRGLAKHSDFGPIEGYILERCNIGGKFVLISIRKSYMNFRLVSKSVTLNDRERCNGPYIALFHRIR